MLLLSTKRRRPKLESDKHVGLHEKAHRVPSPPRRLQIRPQQRSSHGPVRVGEKAALTQYLNSTSACDREAKKPRSISKFHPPPPPVLLRMKRKTVKPPRVIKKGKDEVTTRKDYRISQCTTPRKVCSNSKIGCCMQTPLQTSFAGSKGLSGVASWASWPGWHRPLLRDARRKAGEAKFGPRPCSSVPGPGTMFREQWPGSRSATTRPSVPESTRSG